MPTWATLMLPALLRARKLRNRLQGHPEMPPARRPVLAQGILNGSGTGHTLVEVRAQPGQPIWDTVCARCELVTGQRVNVARVLDVQADADPVRIRFALRPAG
jgi:hypothetical protein